MEGLEVVLTLEGGAIVRVTTGPIITGETLQGHSNIVGFRHDGRERAGRFVKSGNGPGQARLPSIRVVETCFARS